jgi:hypothetical protein
MMSLVIRHPEVLSRSGGLEGRRPPILGLPEIGIEIAKVGYSRLVWPIILRGSLRSHLRMTVNN